MLPIQRINFQALSLNPELAINKKIYHFSIKIKLCMRPITTLFPTQISKNPKFYPKIILCPEKKYGKEKKGE